MDYYGYQVYNRNDIRHWKYIKRERVNGKWRYYYDDPEYRNALNRYNLAKSNTTTIALRRAANKVNYDAANRKVSRDWMRSRDGKKYIWRATPQSMENDRIWRQARKKYLEYDRLLKIAQEDEEKARKKYKKIKLSSAPRRVIAKGASAVANFISKYSK